MRDIKLLVWNPHDKVMYDPMPIVDFTLLRINGHIIRFWTGLKDKNGKEIYEGDIIAWDYEYDSDYDGDMPIVRRSTGKSVVKDIYDRSEIYRARQESKGCWVIGNIYENPELINHETTSSNS